MPRARLVIHVPKSVLAGDEPVKWFYRRLRDGIVARGGAVSFVPHDRLLLPVELAEDEDFHIVDHGELRHPRVLNAGIAYIFPFWHLDPRGIRAESSIAEMVFDPERIDGGAAQGFFRHLRRRWVEERRSRGAQPAARAPLPEGAIAVFLQGGGDERVRAAAHLDREAMLDALLARDDPRPIVVKPHPGESGRATRDWLAALARRDRRLHVSDANLHDILATARATVTINSAVGIESMLHRVPVVLCGRADFHHAAITVRAADELDGALAGAMARNWPHARFLYWYFRGACLDAGSPTLVEDALARIAASGFDTGRFGLSAGPGGG